jgi:hypothetical protein
MDSHDDEIKFNHKYISLSPLNKKFYGVSLKNQKLTSDEYDEEEEWRSFLEDALEYSDEHSCWVVSKKEINDFLQLIENVEDKFKNDSKYDDESHDESSDDTDDELIQKTLSRRLKSESKQYEIDEDYVSDSQLEDVSSLSRRLRYLYSTVKSLQKRIEKLEKNETTQ